MNIIIACVIVWLISFPAYMASWRHEPEWRWASAIVAAMSIPAVLALIGALLLEASR